MSTDLFSGKKITQKWSPGKSNPDKNNPEKLYQQITRKKKHSENKSSGKNSTDVFS